MSNVSRLSADGSSNQNVSVTNTTPSQLTNSDANINMFENSSSNDQNDNVLKSPSQLTNSYANVMRKELFPSKNQAIVIDSIEGIPLNEYILAVGKVTDPSNIRFASKISRNRVCVYLANKTVADSLTENKSKISIRNNVLEIRPLLTKFKRLILSNVCPIIPHYILEQELKKLNIRLGSSLTFLRAGISEPGFSHVLSFRRQVYIHPDDINNIPSSLKIYYDDTVFWVYLSTDVISCFICKQQGHLAKSCDENPHKISDDPQIPDKEGDKNNVNITVTEDFPPLTLPPSERSSPAVNTILPSSETEVPPKTTKRALSLSSSNKDEVPVENDQEFTVKTKRKKPKKCSSTENSNTLDFQLAPIKDTLSNSDTAPILSYIELKSFLDRATGNPNIKDLSLEFTSDTDALIFLLKENYSKLTDRKMKNRFTRIINKLTVTNRKEVDDYPSGTSDEDVSTSQ